MNIALIQCRMNSTRLPGKALLELSGKPVIKYVYDRVKQAIKLDRVIVATGDEDINKELVQYCESVGIKIICGEQDNVLKRFCDIVRELKLADCDKVVRITADCPLVDPVMIDDMLEFTGIGYYTNQYYCIDGTDIEIIRVSKLLEAEQEYGYDEHVTLKLKEKYKFSKRYAYGNINLSHIHLSLDTQEDYDNIKKIINQLPENFGYKDIVEVVWF